MNWQRTIFICVILIIAAMAWIGRYEIVAGHEYAYRLDKWTGGISFIHSGNYWNVEKISNKN
jgi:hypothetical protein